MRTTNSPQFSLLISEKKRRDEKDTPEIILKISREAIRFITSCDISWKLSGVVPRRR